MLTKLYPARNKTERIQSSTSLLTDPTVHPRVLRKKRTRKKRWKERGAREGKGEVERGQK